MEMKQRASVMSYGDSRYLKLFAILVIPAILAYMLLPSKATQSGGGTPLGYVLGILSCAIVVILMLYGYRKRCSPNYSERRKPVGPGVPADAAKENDAPPKAWQIAARYKLRDQDRRKNQSPHWRYGQTLQGWLSAHLYLGAALFVLVTLHAGFEFGWNVHTLAYVLTMVVIASGFYGLYLYLDYPQRMTDNLGEDSLEDMIAQIEELNETARIRALELPDELNHLVYRSRIETCLGGNFWQQISGTRSNCPTEYAIRQIQSFGQKYTKEEQPKFLRDLYSVMLRKQKLVFRAREAIKLKARMDAWLYLHVPFSMALLAAIGAHVLSIFFFW
jgi:hypothetical protein